MIYSDINKIMYHLEAITNTVLTEEKVVLTQNCTITLDDYSLLKVMTILPNRMIATHYSQELDSVRRESSSILAKICESLMRAFL